MCLFVGLLVRGLKIQEIVVWSGHGLVTARGGRVRAERSEVWVTHRAKRGHCTWRDMPSEARCGFRNVRAGDKAERSEVWVTDNESRAKQGVGYAMLVEMKQK